MTDRERRLLREKFGPDYDFAAADRRMREGEPLAYLLGEWYFYDETYIVTPDVLIPRPDTEHLVDAARKALKAGDTLLDLCCGSGCVGISAVLHAPGTSVLLCDVSEKALGIARRNAERNRAADRASFRRTDVLDAEQLRALGSFPVVTANPPYIRTGLLPSLETIRREPRLALDGGEDGLRFYRALTAAFPMLVKEGGVMLLEIGWDQGDALRRLAADASLSCEIRRDYGGNERVAVLKRA